MMAVSPTVSCFEYLDIAGAVLTERLMPVDGMVTAARARARTGLGRDRGGTLRLLVMVEATHAGGRYAFLRAWLNLFLTA